MRWIDPGFPNRQVQNYFASPIEFPDWLPIVRKIY